MTREEAEKYIQAFMERCDKERKLIETIIREYNSHNYSASEKASDELQALREQPCENETGTKTLL